jgi:hypothetical protein
MNGVHTEAARAFQVQRAVIYEKALLRRALGDLQGNAKDSFLRLAGANVTGTEEDLKIAAKIEGLYAVLIEFEWFVIDGTDEEFSGHSEIIENGTRIRILLGLRKHKGGELLACEGALAVEKRAV